MRFLPIDDVIPGSYLAKPIYNTQGAIMLQKDFKLTEGLICRLKEYGMKGLYIEDDISSGIDIEETLDLQLKLEATAKLETIIKNNDNIAQMQPIISDIVDSIIANKDVVLHINRIHDYHNYTYSHCINVGILAISIGVKYNFNRDELIKLGTAGILHDIGKSNVPIEILNKPGELTEKEFAVIRNHPMYGYNMLKEMTELSSVTRIGVLQHHERIDGLGYPKGLKDSEITIFAKIIAVADTYDAMTSDRSYRPAYSSVEAYEFILGDGNTRFDINVVDKFTKCIAVYSVGTCVELSDGTEAIVIKNNLDNPLRPLLRDIRTNKIIDLKNNMNYLSVCISKVITPNVR